MVIQTPRKHVFVSGVHASSKSEDGETFTVTMGNSIGVTHASGLTVSQVTIPHVFPNINKYRQTWHFDGIDYVIPIAQYTAAELVTELNTQLVGTGIVHAFNAATNIWTITNNAGHDIDASLTSEQWDFLGYNWRDDAAVLQTSGPNEGRYDFTIPDTATLTAQHVPNMAGEMFVNIACRQLAHSNLVHGGDGIQYDIMCPVPLSNIEYLGVQSFIVPHAEYASVNFANAIAMDQTLEFHVLDSRMRRLSVPLNHHVEVFFCAHHHLGT